MNLEKIKGAIEYSLRRMQTDPDFRYYMAHTQAWAMLCEALAELTGEPMEKIREESLEDRQPAYRMREPDVVIYRRRLDKIQTLIEHANGGSIEAREFDSILWPA